MPQAKRTVAMDNATASSGVPHILMVSFPGQGHLNPLIRLASRIAAKGVLVTLCSTDEIGRRISASTGNSALDVPKPVGDGFVRFEFFDDGLAMDDPGRKKLGVLLTSIRTTGPPALAGIIRRNAEASRPVSCVINNPFMPWALDVAAEVGIPSGVLWVQSCAVIHTCFSYYHSLAEFPNEKNPDVTVRLPGLPPMKTEELPTFFLWPPPEPELKQVILEQIENITKASWVFANTFEELEREAIDAISDKVSLIPVGPLVESPSSNPSVRGDLFKAADHCVGWLDAQEPRSVVYVSLGSVVVLSKEEMTEMAWGLKNSGRPFLWVVRRDAQALLPEGFIDEIADGGLVVEWSPQERVLEHPAVACFVTQCGWNATLEALTAGVPMVAYPKFADQVPDAKFVVEVFGLGVRLGAPAAREEVKQCVEAVTQGKGADTIKKKATAWKDAAKKAVAEGGSSDSHIQAFVDEIKKRAATSPAAIPALN